jgi:hypothetical protein
MPFDKLAVDQGGMARSQTRWHAVLLLEFAHVGFDAVVNLESIVLEVADPFFAAAAVGVTVDFNGDQVSGLGQGGNEKGAQGDQTQVGSHVGSRLGWRSNMGILTSLATNEGGDCFQVMQKNPVGAELASDSGAATS